MAARSGLRRTDPKFAQHLKDVSCSPDGPITEIEADGVGWCMARGGGEGRREQAKRGAPTRDGSLGIGSLRRGGRRPK